MMVGGLFSPVHAQELDTVRVGGDYEFITLKLGASFKECRRACNDDSSCKAWTFVKEREKPRKGISFNLGPDLRIGLGGKREMIPPQCRLKYTAGEAKDSGCCISGVKKKSNKRKVAKREERCTDYADEAIQQQDENLSKRCDLFGDDWHGNYRRHFKYCMKNRAKTVNALLDERSEELKDCGRTARKTNRQCERYADTAMTVFEELRDNQCDSKLPRYTTAYNRVYDWCQDHSKREREVAMEKNREKLAACIKRGGGPRVAACETQADDLMALSEKAEKNSCDFAGSGRWAADYKEYYQSCRKQSPRTRRKTLARMTASVDECIEEQSKDLLADIGRIELRQSKANQWYSVKFRKRMKDPVVIIGPASSNVDDPVHARIRRVTSRGFDFKLEEFDGDGRHDAEVLSYLAVEKGVHRFNGMVIEAGNTRTKAMAQDKNWKRVYFQRDWRRDPIVFSQVQSYRGGDPVVTRMRDIDREGFEVSLSEKEADRRGHTREVVGYVAIEPGLIKARGRSGRDDVYVWATSLRDRINHRFSDVNFPRRYGNGEPALFAQAQGSRGPDTFVVRYARLGERRVKLRVQEETSKDRETKHIGEQMAVLTMPYGKYWASESNIREERRDDPEEIGGGQIASYFGRAELLLNEYGRKTGGWNNLDHVRKMADVNGDGKADIVGFGRRGVYVSLNRRRGYAKPELWLEAFGNRAGDWNNEDHARTLADVNGDGRADIVGFGNDGVYVSLGRSRRFDDPERWSRQFSAQRGGWSSSKHERTLADVDGDGRADLVGFGDKGVYIALAGRNGFGTARLELDAFGRKRGGWNTSSHVRTLADVNGDGRADIVGFGDAGVFVSLNRNGQFRDPDLWLKEFGRKSGGWNNRDHERVLRDVNGDGRADIVGFGNAGVYVALSQGDGFDKAELVLEQFGRKAGGWNGRDHERTVADVDGDKHPDIVGFGNAGVYVSYLSGEFKVATGGASEASVSGWEKLGCTKVAFRRDKDAVSVGKSKGRFKALKLGAEGISVNVSSLDVVYGNGKTRSLPFKGKVTKGTKTSDIDLHGKQRFVKSVSLVHSAKVNFGKMNFLKGGAKLCVYGLK